MYLYFTMYKNFSRWNEVNNSIHGQNGTDNLKTARSEWRSRFIVSSPDPTLSRGETVWWTKVQVEFLGLAESSRGTFSKVSSDWSKQVKCDMHVIF